MVSATKAIGLAVIVLFVAFAVPQFVTTSSDGDLERTETITGGVGDSVQFNDALVVGLEDKNSQTVDLQLTSVQTGDNTTVTLTESESASLSLDNRTITITAIDVQVGTDGDVTVRVNYPNDFGWTTEAKTLTNNLPVLFVAVAFVIVAGLITAVMRS